MVQIPVDRDNLNIGRKRETRIYYRTHRNPNGDVVWIPTTPLPADPWHLNYYTKKGFKLWPPGKEPGQEEMTEAHETVAELEARAAAIKEANASSEDAKAELDAEVKILEEQAATLKEAMGGVKVERGRISCPEPDCTAVVKTYMGLARHMKIKHEIK